jgi:hypothetical protein
VTTPTPEPGDRRPLLDRPPSDRYAPRVSAPDADPLAPILVPLGIVVGGAIGFTVLGGLLTMTFGLVILAAFLGWLIGKVVSPPWRAALVGLGMVVLGLLGIWLFGRIEGGVLDPITYFGEVQGWPLVVLELLAGGGLAAASSR